MPRAAVPRDAPFGRILNSPLKSWAPHLPGFTLRGVVIEAIVRRLRRIPLFLPDELARRTCLPCLCGYRVFSLHVANLFACLRGYVCVIFVPVAIKLMQGGRSAVVRHHRGTRQ